MSETVGSHCRIANSYNGAPKVLETASIPQSRTRDLAQHSDRTFQAASCMPSSSNDHIACVLSLLLHSQDRDPVLVSLAKAPATLVNVRPLQSNVVIHQK